MRLRSAFPILMATLLIAAAGGCGGGGDEPSESYAELLHGLKQAALSNSHFDAVSRAEGLRPAQRAAIDGFCETNSDMLLNKEAEKASQAGYYVTRIKLWAERELPFVSTRPVNVAVRGYRDLFGLDSFDKAQVERYARACFH